MKIVGWIIAAVFALPVLAGILDAFAWFFVGHAVLIDWDQSHIGAFVFYVAFWIVIAPMFMAGVSEL